VFQRVPVSHGEPVGVNVLPLFLPAVHVQRAGPEAGVVQSAPTSGVAPHLWLQHCAEQVSPPPLAWHSPLASRLTPLVQAAAPRVPAYAPRRPDRGPGSMAARARAAA
jgi:hypothetical protein